MNNEYLKSLIDTVSGIEVKSEAEQIAKYELIESCIKYKEIIDKAIEYIRSEYTITDDDVYLALYSSDGTLDKLENILKGSDNNE